MSDLGDLQGKVCSRCKVEPAVVSSRREVFCSACFIRFISGKQRKQMNADKFKVKFDDNVHRERVLFPVSFGQSSLVLLDILISLYDEQLLNPRAQLGYELVVLYVDDSSVERYKRTYKEVTSALEERYQFQKYKYPITFTRLDIDSFVQDQDSLRKITLLKDFTTFKYPITESNITVEQIFKACPNRASRHDLKQIIINSLIFKYAYAHGINTVLLGNNMSTLAEQVLSLTVKGRGSEIYSELSDGIKTFQGKAIDFLNPLRDVSSREVNLFSQYRDLQNFELVDLSVNDNVMSKQKTINEIVSKYYRAVDTEYDNIVSTVVKTGAKLTEPRNFDGETCTVCNNKIYNKPMEWLESITYNGDRGPENEIEEEYLKKWQEANRVLLERLEQDDKESCSVCYGCAVTIGGNVEQTVVWPTRDDDHDHGDVQKILDQFIIGEDSDDE